MTVRARGLAVVALTVAACAGGACGRLARRSPRAAPARPDSAPPVAVTPPTADTGRAAADSALGDSARAPARADSAAGRDSARAPRARRREIDPASRCREVDFNDSPPTARLTAYQDPTNGTRMTFVGGGVVARCGGVNNTLRSDSAEHYESAGYLVLVGNVAYDEPGRVRMNSQRLTYYITDERLFAENGVLVVLPSGTSMIGPNAEYLRAVPRVRTRSRLTATGRPTLRLVEAPTPPSRAPGNGTPSTASANPATGAAATRSAASDTATVTANTIVDDGDSLVFASGLVQIVRTDVTATSDSATVDQLAETARLVRNASIRGTGSRTFTLTGVVVDLFSRARSLTRVFAQDSARIVSEDLNLRSDTVDLRLDSGRVERAYAWGPSRALATSPDREIAADSIDALLPDQRIRELRALRGAVARSAPDTTRIRSTERDLLRGDTLLALFDSAAAPQDTTRNPPIRQLVSAGNASALYQLATSSGRDGPPAINYVRGRIITVSFDSNQVQTVVVTDSADGVYLDPSADSSGDSTGGRAAARRPARPARGTGAERAAPPRNPLGARRPRSSGETSLNVDTPFAATPARSAWLAATRRRPTRRLTRGPGRRPLTRRGATHG